jgi:hypothetical protein
LIIWLLSKLQICRQQSADILHFSSFFMIELYIFEKGSWANFSSWEHLVHLEPHFEQCCNCNLLQIYDILHIYWLFFIIFQYVAKTGCKCINDCIVLFIYPLFTLSPPILMAKGKLISYHLPPYCRSFIMILTKSANCLDLTNT